MPTPVRGLLKRKRQDISLQVPHFPLALHITVKQAAAGLRISLKRWVIDACLLKLATDRRDRMEDKKTRG